MNIKKIPAIVSLLAMWGLLTIGLIVVGCVTPTTSTDIVVKAEQVESGTLAAFNFVVQADDANRGFWITNAPAFHQFAEWLRTPVTNNGVMYRRGLLMIRQLDAAKSAYKSNVSESNALLNAISDLQLAKSQAETWQLIISTKTP